MTHDDAVKAALFTTARLVGPLVTHHGLIANDTVVRVRYVGRSMYILPDHGDIVVFDTDLTNFVI